MISSRGIVIAVITLSCVAAASAGPVTHVLGTTSYNYQLDGGGGGAQATLDGVQNIEIFCVDYANDIWVPQTYSSYLTSLTQGSNLSETRFGNVTSWSTINTGDSGDSAAINGATDLGRYQMAAYLVSQYSFGYGKTQVFGLGGGSTNNDSIQQAIWDVLDPKTFSLFSSQTTNNALDAAAQWYTSTGGNAGSAGRDSFLSNFRIVSDSTMKGCGDRWVNCGFQEQITVVPEPRHLAAMLIGMLIVCAGVFRRFQLARSPNR